MNPEAQRIAIAEVCGWQLKSHEDARYAYLKPPGRLSLTFKRNVAISALPDHLNDLNAMHEAEKTLGKRSATYANVLEEVCRRDRGDLVSNGQKWHATAAQRAEAFLRVLDKWQD